MMGQGGCMAMEDACILAESLRTESTVAAALASYVSRRRPRVSWVHQESDAVAQSFRLLPPCATPRWGYMATRCSSAASRRSLPAP